MLARPAAVLWDMDGTLVDTEPYWIATEFALAERHGATWSTEHALNLVGNDLLTSGRYIREHMGLELSPEEIVEELLDGVVARVREAVPWRPGARELLETLAAWFEHGASIEGTARALFVHPNTVRYRLRQVAEVTGWSPTRPREAFALQLALILGRQSGRTEL